MLCYITNPSIYGLMKNYLYIISIWMLTLYSCNTNQKQMATFNSLLTENYEFATKTLNVNKGEYYLRIEERPEFKNPKLNQLDSTFEKLMKDIDEVIQENSNIEDIILRSEALLTAISEIVKNHEDYLTTPLNKMVYDESISSAYRLLLIKNKLSIAMSYAFEYAFGNSILGLGCQFGRSASVDTKISYDTNNNVVITLAGKGIQQDRENRHIIINALERNGKATRVDHFLHTNYAFADIKFDSLQKGNYQLNGIVRYYKRTGKIDIPFEESFTVK